MASNRHLGRIVALQTLYEFDFRQECNDEDLSVDEVLGRNIERYMETIEDKDFIRDLVHGVVTDIDNLDGIIQPIAPEWPIAQIARIDRNILRMSIWELNHSEDVPPKVVINEAVELAKSFGSDNSSKFVNGVLGTAFRNLEAEAKPESKSKSKSTKPKKTTTSASSKQNSQE